MNKLLKTVVMATVGLSIANVHAEEDMVAPLNPAFARWSQSQSDAKRLRLQQAGGVNTKSASTRNALIPLPVDLRYLHDHYRNGKAINALKTTGLKIAQSSSGDELPISYNVEGASQTPVKDQGSYGTCWAHAAMGSIEAQLIKTGLGTFDLSENNLANLSGFDWTFSEGGQAYMSTAYLSRMAGPVLEVEDGYPNVGGSPAGLKQCAHVGKVLWIPYRDNALDNAVIKRAVQKFGAVYVSYYHQGEGSEGGVNPTKDSPYWNASKAAYYMGSYKTSNHAVCIVGWDDNYSAANFSTKPAGDGAFLIKNSWGTSWGVAGMEGYEWISYYDATLNGHSSDYEEVETAFVFTDVTAPRYDAVYGYDDLGMVNSCGDPEGGCYWGAAIHTAKADANIAAVGVYMTEPNAEYTIFIYKGCERNKPRTGTLIGSATGSAGEYAGFQTIRVNCQETISKDDRFSIVVAMTTKSTRQLAIEYPTSNYSSKATASTGETFLSIDGEDWSDFRNLLSSSGIYNCSFCCKAYVQNVENASKGTFNVTFAANNGVGSMSSGKGTYDSQYTFPECGFSRKGWTFAGWLCEQNGNIYKPGESVAFAEDDFTGDTLVLEALWELEESECLAAPFITECTKESPDKVALKWEAVNGATKYNIYFSRSTVFANAILRATVLGKTAYDDICSPGYIFYYWVTAVDADGNESEEGEWEIGYRVPECEVSKSDFAFNADGGQDSLNITINCRWKAKASASWIKVDESAHAEDVKTLSFSIEANTAATSRSATIDVIPLCGDADGYTRTIVVSQSGQSAALPSAPQWKKYVYTSDGVYLEWEAATSATSYDIYRKVTYADRLLSENEELLASGLTDLYYVDATATALGAAYEYRVAAVNASGSSYSEKASVIANLLGEAAISWSVDRDRFSCDGGTATISLTIVGTETYDAYSMSDWLHVSSDGMTVTVTADANASAGKRYGSVVVGCGKMLNYNGDTVHLTKEIISFTQDGTGESSEVAEGSYVATVGAGGGRGSVSVKISAAGKYVFLLAGRPNWVTKVQASSDITGSSTYTVNWLSTGTMDFTFTCQPNVGEARTWAVPFTKDGVSAGTVIIQQKSPDGTADDIPESEGDPATVTGSGTMYPTLAFTANGGSGSAKLALQPAYAKWGYEYYESWFGRPSWVEWVERNGIVVAANTSGGSNWSTESSTPEFYFEIGPNYTSSERTYTIKVNHYLNTESETIDGQIGLITVKQAAGSVVLVRPETVTGIEARTVSTSAISLTWNASSGADFYKVLRAPMGRNEASDYDVVCEKTTLTTFVDTGLAAGSSFYYVIAACNDVGEVLSDRVVGQTKEDASSGSGEVSSGEVKPNAPGKPYSNGLGAGSISLGWDAAEGATTYKVLRAQGEDGAFKVVAFDLTSCSFGDNFLEQNAVYRYKIVAVNKYGETEGEEAMFSTRALKFGPGEASEFMISATERATVVGVSSLVWSNFAQRDYKGQQSESDKTKHSYYTFDDDRVIDVEKNSTIENSDAHDTDDYWCQQFSCLDSLYWGGYVTGVGSADEIADACRQAKSTDAIFSCAPVTNDSSCQDDQTGFAIELTNRFNRADTLLVMGVSFDENFIWKGQQGVSHAVVCCGYSLDASKSDLSDPSALKGLFIIDPDNDMFNGAGASSAPNSITYCPLKWDSVNKVYEISNVFGATGEVYLYRDMSMYIRSKNAIAASAVHKTVNTAVMGADDGDDGDDDDGDGDDDIGGGGGGGGGGGDSDKKEEEKVVDPVVPSPVVPENEIALEEVAQLYDEDAPLTAETATTKLTYNAFILEDGGLAGTLQVTTGKADKNGKVAVKATLVENGQKTNLTGTLGENGQVVLADKKGSSITVVLGENGLTSSEEGVTLSGSKNTLGEKSATAELAKWKGNWSAVMTVTDSDGSAAGYISLSIAVGSKGATKVSGTLPDATKISTSTTIITDDAGNAFVAVDAPLYSKKGGFSALLALTEDGGVKIVGSPKWDTTGSKSAFTGEVALENGAQASASTLTTGSHEVAVDAGAFGDTAVTNALPSGSILTVNNGKISCPKAGKVTLDKKTGEIVTTGDNPSALKLSYTAKTGAVKGSFNVYRIENGKLKKYSMTVLGTLVGDTVYATASNKKLGIATAFNIQ